MKRGIRRSGERPMGGGPADPETRAVAAQDPSRRSRFWTEPCVFFVLGLIIRLASVQMAHGLGRIHPREYLEYVHVGERFLQFGTLVNPLTFAAAGEVPSAILPPAYAAFVAAVFRVFGVRTFAAILTLQLVNALAGAVAIVLVYGAAWHLGGGVRARGSLVAARVAAGLAAMNPCLFAYTWMIWDTNLFILGVCVAVWLSLRLGVTRDFNDAAGRESLTRWLAFGVFLGALAHLNPSFTTVYPLLVLWPLVARLGWRPRALALPVAACVIGWAAALIPWTIRNHVHTGRLLYVRCGLPMEFWLGVCPDADVGGADVFRSEFPLSNADAERRILEIGETAFIDDCGRRAWAAIRQDPWRYAKLVGIRIVDYWAGTVFEHSPTGSGWPTRRGRAAATLFLLAEAIAAIALTVAAGVLRRLPMAVPWLLAMLGSFSVVYCLTHIQLRYRAPSEPLLALMIGLLVSRAWPRRHAEGG